MAEKPFAEYAERNSGPILEVLQDEFKGATRVLEIGSGTGQHATYFATALPHLAWQTSDLPENHAGIRSWVDDSGLSNLLPPLTLNVLSDDVPDSGYDAVFSANTAHIMSFEAVTRMFLIVGAALSQGGVFCLYGPFRQHGEFNTESNARFDASLRQRDENMGIRDLERLDELGRDNGLERVRIYAMPANNHIAVWIKEGV